MTPRTPRPRRSHARGERAQYTPPPYFHSIGIWRLIDGIRSIPPLRPGNLNLAGTTDGTLDEEEDGLPLFFSGDIELARRKCVAIVGSRKVSPGGLARARILAHDLASSGVVVVSGLAEGVDAAAHRAAIEAGGRTIAVIGTPLDKAYPAANGPLQEEIYRHHLLISPFPPGTRTFPSSFPKRNRVMAAISDATAIIEATDTSGTLHQAAECQPDRLNRWLFIDRAVRENPANSWPSRFLPPEFPKNREFTSAADILRTL